MEKCRRLGLCFWWGVVGLVGFIIWMVGLGNPVENCFQEGKAYQWLSTAQEREIYEDCEEKFAAFRTWGSATFFGGLFFGALILFWDALVDCNNRLYRWRINAARSF